MFESDYIGSVDNFEEKGRERETELWSYDSSKSEERGKFSTPRTLVNPPARLRLCRNPPSYDDLALEGEWPFKDH